METKEVKEEGEKKKEKGKKTSSAEKVAEKPTERRGSVVTLGGQDVAYTDLRVAHETRWLTLLRAALRPAAHQRSGEAA